MRMHILKLDPNTYDENAVEFVGKLTGTSGGIEEGELLQLTVKATLSGRRWVRLGRPVELDVDDLLDAWATPAAPSFERV